MTELAKLIGAEEVEATQLDGTTVKVKVSALPLSKMDKWLSAQEDEPLMIQVATGLSTEALDKITTESQEQLLKVAEDLNSSFFERFVTRRVQRAQKLESYAASAKSSSSE